jgi:hypothetical protein
MACTETDIGSYNFVVRQGDDKIQKFRYVADGTPVDLTGATIEFECALTKFTQTAVITSAVNGEFEITFARADTVDLSVFRVKYEVSITNATNLKKTIFVGTIHFPREVVA